MYRLFTVLGCLILSSCEWVSSPTPVKEELVQKELQTLDWNEVDRYPLFEHCDETAVKDTQKRCLSSGLTSHFYKTFLEQELSVYSSLNDTVLIQLIIDNKGKAIIDSVVASDRVRRSLPQLDSLISLGIQNLPPLYPALKRNVPVRTRMVLPLVLKAQ